VVSAEADEVGFDISSTILIGSRTPLSEQSQNDAASSACTGCQPELPGVGGTFSSCASSSASSFLSDDATITTGAGLAEGLGASDLESVSALSSLLLAEDEDFFASSSLRFFCELG
jgi:hypothetical protein